MNNFKLIVIALLGFGAVLGIFVFAGFIDLENNVANSGPTGTVTLWGTVPSNLVNPLIDEFNKNNTYTVKYVRKVAQNFDEELLEAMALGKGPDLFLLPDNLTFKYKNKIYPIPYTNYPLINFKNNFATAGEVFLDNKGILALPISIDPMVMYYNRTILDSNNVVYPPVYWDELHDFANIFTKKDGEEQIVQSAFALGQFNNVSYAKDILSTLFMQTGSPIVSEQNGLLRADLDNSQNDKNVNTVSSLDFYTSFSNPVKPNYSWNKSLPLSIDAFSKEDLVFYFGFASNLKTLLDKNPNQDFQVATIPQLRNTNNKLTSARVTGLAISAFSKNLPASVAAATGLAGGDFARDYSNSQLIPPARRDLLAVVRQDSYFPVFYASSLFARSWLDPSASDSSNIFRAMVEEVLSNAKKPDTAIFDANNRLNILLFTGSQ